MRVVLGTNCVVSALLFRHGRLPWLREAWEGGENFPVVDRATVAELARVCGYRKFRLDPQDRIDRLGLYLPKAELADGLIWTGLLPLIRDPADLPILALALAAQVEALVTGDQDLLVLAGSVAVPASTPAELALRLGRHAAPAPSAS